MLTVIDQCLPCYLQDHVNGDNEILISVPLHHGVTHAEVADMALTEYRQYEDTRLEGIDGEVETLLTEGLQHLFPADASERVYWEDPDHNPDEDDEGESVYLFLRLNFSELRDQ